MTAGYGLTRADLDVRMGTVVVNVRDSLRQAVLMDALLNNANIIPNDAFLTASPFSYQQAEVTSFRAAFASLKKLSDIANNTATQSTTNNFFFDAQKLTGLVL